MWKCKVINQKSKEKNPDKNKKKKGGGGNNRIFTMDQKVTQKRKKKTFEPKVTQVVTAQIN